MKNKIKDLLKKFKSLFKKKNNISTFFKKIFKNKENLTKAIIILLVIIIILFLLNSLVFSRLERVKINEVNNKLSNYLDEVVLYPEDEGRYISFAIEYLYSTTEKKEYRFDEVLEVINDTFLLNYTEKDLEKIGITLQMADKGIVIEGNNREYIYNNKKTRADIASTPVVKFYPINTKRISVNKYKVTYDKYVVENPYEILNYYEEKNLTAKKKYDTSDIVEYLKGNRKMSVIKNAITDKNIEKFGKIDGKISITFVVKNNKVLIKKIG